jgi:hypothetical protein
MIDYVSFKLQNVSNSDFEKLTELVNVECRLNSNKVFFDLYNLRIFYYPNSKILFVKNSVHKFYNASIGIMQQGENYNDFNICEMNVVAQVLSEVYFNRPIEDFELSTKLEVGVNVDIVGYRPFDIIDRYLSYQVYNTINSFVTSEPRNDKGKPIMRKCYLSDYQLKFYDKSKQANIYNQNILRYEVVFSELRKIRAVLGKDNLTMQTLCDLDTWSKFGSYLLEVYGNIRKLPIIENAEISEYDLNKIHAHCSKHFKEDLIRAMPKSQYNTLRLLNQQVYKFWDSSSDNIHIEIENKIKLKISKLINVPVS